MKRLDVIYDAECALCCRCREWLMQQWAWVPMRFVPLQSLDLEERYPGIKRFHPEKEIVVISDEGFVYQGAKAWIICLFALAEYREWALKLSNPVMMPQAKRFVEWVSGQRLFLSQLLPGSAKECGNGRCNINGRA